MAKKVTKKVVKKKPVKRPGIRTGKKPSLGKVMYDAQIGLGMNGTSPNLNRY